LIPRRASRPPNQSPPISTDRAVASDHAMARNGQADRVPADGPADRPGRPPPADRPRDPAVAVDLTPAQRSDRAEDRPVPVAAIGQVERQLPQRRRSSVEIRLQRRNRLRESREVDAA